MNKIENRVTIAESKLNGEATYSSQARESAAENPPNICSNEESSTTPPENSNQGTSHNDRANIPETGRPSTLSSSISSSSELDNSFQPPNLYPQLNLN